jgi:hypothetical protein
MTDRGFKDGGHKDRHHLFTRIWGDITWQKDALCQGRMDWCLACLKELAKR